MTQTLKIVTSGDRDLVITRQLDASRSLVWQALTKPEFLRRWLLGPPGWEMTVCENDQRVGGRFRHVWKQQDGSEMAMSGVYHEVVEPVRIVRTETFEFGCQSQAGEQHATLELEETAGITTITITVHFSSKEARDGMLASGMERGVKASYDRMQELLLSLNA